MSQILNRRDFLSQSLIATVGAAVVSSAAEPAGSPKEPNPPSAAQPMPGGKIGKLSISRLISGGNLISGWAHSRDLHYVADLMRHYNTDDKVMDTLELLEKHGVNTIITDPNDKTFRIFGKYWKERGGKIQWIAEGHPRTDDWKTNIQKSIDFGASAIYVQGVISDQWLKEDRLDFLGNCVRLVKSQGLPGGIGAHELEVIVQSEKHNYGADFYVKTLHHGDYWSRRKSVSEPDVVSNAADNYWDRDPEKTIAFMREVEKPWIAFKVLAAGGIRPESGFAHAFRNGADHICVGMFDFQVEPNVALALDVLRNTANRERAWMS
ncbi:exported hypothetical protein [Verrucomicrobia bacterium]|nr:exported hypothetical protein [Verrucomicrobiota bacterium]